MNVYHKITFKNVFQIVGKIFKVNKDEKDGSRYRLVSVSYFQSRYEKTMRNKHRIMKLLDLFLY